MSIRIEQLDLRALAGIFVNRNKEAIIRALLQTDPLDPNDPGIKLTPEDCERLGIDISSDTLLDRFINGMTDEQLIKLISKLAEYLSVDSLKNILSRFTKEDVTELGFGLDSFKPDLHPDKLTKMLKELTTLNSKEVITIWRDGLIQGLKNLTEEEKKLLDINNIGISPNIKDEERVIYLDLVENIVNRLKQYLTTYDKTLNDNEKNRIKTLIMELENIVSKYGGKEVLINATKTSEEMFKFFLKEISGMLYTFRDIIMEYIPDIKDLVYSMFKEEIQLLNMLVMERVHIIGNELIIENPFGIDSFPIVRVFRHKYGAGMTTSSPAGGTPPETVDAKVIYDDNKIYVRLPMMYKNAILEQKEVYHNEIYRYALTFKGNVSDNVTVEVIKVGRVATPTP